MRYFLPALLLPLMLASCVSAPEYPSEPVITFESLNKAQIKAYRVGDPSSLDSIRVQFSFTDGDGDISRMDSITDIILTDNREEARGAQFGYSVPQISAEGTGNGTSGDIFITLVNETLNICCIVNNRLCVEDPAFPTTTLTYSIQLLDRAGNLSNVIETTPIDILCLGE